MMETALLYLPWALSVLFAGIAIWLYFPQRTSKQPQNNRLEEELDQFEEQIFNISEEISDLYKDKELKEAKIAKLESEFASLHEFVNTNLKKMSTRAQRAEQLHEVLEQSKELDNNQGEIFVPPNGRRGRLIKR